MWKDSTQSELSTITLDNYKEKLQIIDILYNNQSIIPDQVAWQKQEQELLFTFKTVPTYGIIEVLLESAIQRVKVRGILIINQGLTSLEYSNSSYVLENQILLKLQLDYNHKLHIKEWNVLTDQLFYMTDSVNVKEQRSSFCSAAYPNMITEENIKNPKITFLEDERNTSLITMCSMPLYSYTNSSNNTRYEVNGLTLMNEPFDTTQQTAFQYGDDTNIDWINGVNLNTVKLWNLLPNYRLLFSDWNINNQYQQLKYQETMIHSVWTYYDKSTKKKSLYSFRLNPNTHVILYKRSNGEVINNRDGNYGVSWMINPFLDEFYNSRTPYIFTNEKGSNIAISNYAGSDHYKASFFQEYAGQPVIANTFNITDNLSFYTFQKDIVYQTIDDFLNKTNIYETNHNFLTAILQNKTFTTKNITAFKGAKLPGLENIKIDTTVEAEKKIIQETIDKILKDYHFGIRTIDTPHENNWADYHLKAYLPKGPTYQLNFNYHSFPEDDQNETNKDIILSSQHEPYFDIQKKSTSNINNTNYEITLKHDFIPNIKGLLPHSFGAISDIKGVWHSTKNGAEWYADENSEEAEKWGYIKNTNTYWSINTLTTHPTTGGIQIADYNINNNSETMPIESKYFDWIYSNVNRPSAEGSSKSNDKLAIQIINNCNNFQNYQNAFAFVAWGSIVMTPFNIQISDCLVLGQKIKDTIINNNDYPLFMEEKDSHYYLSSIYNHQTHVIKPHIPYMFDVTDNPESFTITYKYDPWMTDKVLDTTLLKPLLPPIIETMTNSEHGPVSNLSITNNNNYQVKLNILINDLEVEVSPTVTTPGNHMVTVDKQLAENDIVTVIFSSTTYSNQPTVSTQKTFTKLKPPRGEISWNGQPWVANYRAAVINDNNVEVILYQDNRPTEHIKAGEKYTILGDTPVTHQHHFNVYFQTLDGAQKSDIVHLTFPSL